MQNNTEDFRFWRGKITEEAIERHKIKQSKIRELKAKCSMDENKNPIYIATINLPIKLSPYTYSSNRIPVCFYCPETEQLYDLDCNKLNKIESD